VPRRTRSSSNAPPTAQSKHTAKGAKEAANTGVVAPMVPDGTIPDIATIVQSAVQEALMAERKEQTTKSHQVTPSHMMTPTKRKLGS
jgi:ethanolamine ammonia-lyase small subunit